MKRIALSAAAALIALGLAGPAAAQSGKLVVYTSQPSDQMAKVIELFNKFHPNVQVDLFRSGTTEVINKLRAEIAAGDPKPDILMTANTVDMIALKNEGRLLAYPQASVQGFDKSQYDPDMTYFGTKLITTGIVYNTKAGLPKPQSWKDLVAPAAKGQVIMPSPLYSGAAVIHIGILTAMPDLGWGYYEQLAKLGAVSARGNGSVIEAVARGEKAYGVLIDYMAFGAKAKGSPVDFVFPKEGVTAINQPVAILRTAKNVAAAKAFVDFQLSRAAQEQAVTQDYIPILDGVPPPAGYPDLKAITIMTGDPNAILKADEEIKRRFNDLFGG